MILLGYKWQLIFENIKEKVFKFKTIHTYGKDHLSISGKNGVYVSTVSSLRSPFLGVNILDFYDKAKFNLRAQKHDLTIAGILCEQGDP